MICINYHAFTGTIKKKLTELKPTLFSKFNLEKIGYFGSYVRNEQTENSDIDILVSFTKPIGWGFFDLQYLLEDELNIKVDLVSINALKEQLKEIILNEETIVSKILFSPCPIKYPQVARLLTANDTR